MITTILPLHVGNALRLFIQPPANAVRWKVLRKGQGIFSGHDDPSAIVAYEGDEHVVLDIAHLQNEVLAYYCPFYTADGTTWTAGPVASGTPAGTYEETTTDVLSELRTRLSVGLQIECERGNFLPAAGHIQVFTAPPSLEQNISLPLVTVHLDNEEPAERAIGEYIGGDYFEDGEWSDGEGWLASVSVVIIAWSLNSDERLELRKAIRRLVIANLPVFDALGWSGIDLKQQDVDAISGEYAAHIYQVMSTLTCLAPVRVAGRVAPVNAVNIDVFARS